MIRDNNRNNRVEFISYSGTWPYLCHGVLSLKIDGKIYNFGHNYLHLDTKTGQFLDENPENPNYERFWSSGGYIGCDYEVHTDKWLIDPNSLPVELRDLSSEIDEVFNENVMYGCCGGCI